LDEADRKISRSFFADPFNKINSMKSGTPRLLTTLLVSLAVGLLQPGSGAAAGSPTSAAAHSPDAPPGYDVVVYGDSSGAVRPPSPPSAKGARSFW